MRALWFCLLMLSSVAAASADEAPKPAPRDSTAAFENAYAASFYEFDACGDGLAGRIYRNALVAKLRQCPFSAEAKQRFQLYSAAQRRKSSQMMAKLIENNGGLPVRLEGMTRTCREQIDSPEYRAVRSRLDEFATGKSGPNEVVAQPCDAGEITP